MHRPARTFVLPAPLSRMVAPYAAINLIAAGTKGAAIFIPVTNSIENMIETMEHVCRNVKRWRNADMALRWTVAGIMEAAKGFRRLKAYKRLPALEQRFSPTNPNTRSETGLRTTESRHSFTNRQRPSRQVQQNAGHPPSISTCCQK